MASTNQSTHTASAGSIDIDAWFRSVPLYQGPSETETTSTRITPPNNGNNGLVHPTTSQPSSYLNTVKTQISGISFPRPRIWPSRRTLAVLLLCVVVAIVLRYMHYQPPILTSPHAAEADCLRILRSVQALKVLPLPRAIDHEAHVDVLDELQKPEILTQLISGHSLLNSTLTITIQALVNYIAQVIRIYSHSSDQYPTPTFHNDIRLAKTNLHHTLFHLHALTTLYHTLQPSYHTLNTTSITLYTSSLLTNREEFLICAQFRVLPWFGFFDANKAYLEPLEHRRKTMEKARRGVRAWEREVRSLEATEQVLREVESELQQLEDEVASRCDVHSHGHVGSGHSCDGGPCAPVHMSVRIWDWDRVWESLLNYLRRFHIVKPRVVRVQNPSLEEAWGDLLTSVKKGEQMLAIDVKTE